MFILKNKYTVQTVQVQDYDVFQKLAAHLGLALITPKGWLEFEVPKTYLRDWVYGIADKRDNLFWFELDFFSNLLDLSVDRYVFQCAPAIVVDEALLPGEVLF